ncbi:MAG: DUF937 domain-containing protein [Myxococcales bacterium]|nr:DUF937 domain-containing protein [Myxococcales bacterium]
MSNLLDTILEANGGAVVGQLAREFGLGDAKARDALGQLAPALARGIQRNASTAGGLDSLMKALSEGNHQRYLKHPEELTESASIQDGNGILGHVFGSKDVSRNVAGRASQETGIDASLLKKMLPMLAAAAMGALARQNAAGGSQGLPPRASGSGAGDLLSQFLDADRDGSIVDDVLGLAKKFF